MILLRRHPFPLRLFAGFMVAAVVLAFCTVGFLVACKELFVYSDENVLPAVDDVLWGSAFGQDFATYKFKRASHLDYETLVLGSSRVTQIRDFMLPQSRGFNASLATTDITEVPSFLDQLYKTKLPKLVLLGIDAWWFNPARIGRCNQEDHCKFEFDHRQLVSNAFRRILDPQFLKTLVTNDLHRTHDLLGGRRAIGYAAHRYADGFRPDGSYQYGGVILNLHPGLERLLLGQKGDFIGYRKAVAASRGRFQYVDQPSKEKLDALRTTLKLNKAYGVQTVMFFPSFAAAVWREIENNDDQRRYYSQVHREVSAIAAEYGVEIFDFHDLSALGIDDRHTIDGLHSDEVANLAALLHMIHEGQVLKQYYRPEELEKLTKTLSDPQGWLGPFQMAR